MLEDLWLGRRDADPNADKETWCLVWAGDQLLSSLAEALPGQDLMQTVTVGVAMSSTQVARHVRHGDLAASVVPDGSEKSKRDAARLAAAPQMDLVDRCSVALAAIPAASSILIAAVLAAAVDEPNLARSWGWAAQRVIATGADPAQVHQHRSVAERLSGYMPTPEEVAESLRGETARRREHLACTGRGRSAEAAARA